MLHLHKASSGTADGPTIYFTNQQTGVTGADGFTVGINDTSSPYLWNRENTDLRFGTNKLVIYAPPKRSLVFLFIQYPSLVGGLSSLKGSIFIIKKIV